ncbi:hypothetical protein EPO66_03630 [bacterium]|nr:MAG: hypothetical protein EPO66_03630 [bacterium]
MEKGLSTTNNTALTATEVRKQVNLIQEVMHNVMTEGEHYGKVPGCDKPSLLKPGAEKLMMTFRLAAEYDELLGSTEGDSFICYKINCKLTHIPTGQIIGNGRGVCNSKEKKYRNRSVYLNKATEEEKKIGKEETRTGKTGEYKVLVVPQDPWDVQNTIYKMACKRALVAAILNATAASDIFTQDIEDIDEAVVLNGTEIPGSKPSVETPKEKKDEPTQKQAPATGNEITCQGCDKIITKAEEEYSLKKFNKKLCRECQREESKRG